MNTVICSQVTDKCEGCRHSKPHDWNLPCNTSTCTHFSEIGCKTCPEYVTCGTVVEKNPMTGKDEKHINDLNPLRQHNRLHVACMRCEKFANAAIKDCSCQPVESKR